ncbi:putative holin-like toxin, partial [Bacillus sp. AFS001701]
MVTFEVLSLMISFGM